MESQGFRPWVATAAFLADDLRARFPRHFKDSTPRFEVGGGWFRVVAKTFAQIDEALDDTQAQGFQVTSIYAVEGQLRIDCEPEAPIAAVLAAAQTEAASTCFLCGAGRAQRHGAKCLPLCEPCRTKSRFFSWNAHPLMLDHARLFRAGPPVAGFHLPVGWQSVMARALQDVSALLTDEQVRHFRITQVKEKFAALRVYWQGIALQEEDGEVRAVWRRAEDVSRLTCQVCGAPGKQRLLSGLVVICDRHEGDQVREAAVQRCVKS
jgi:hypothetical protein